MPADFPEVPDFSCCFALVRKKKKTNKWWKRTSNVRWCAGWFPNRVVCICSKGSTRLDFFKVSFHVNHRLMIHMKCQDYSLKKIKVKLFSTAVVIGALRVKWSYTFYTLGHFFFYFGSSSIWIANHNCSRQQFWLFFFFILFATENKSWHFMWIVLADNSHEISTLVFSENRENKLILSTTNFAWHFKGQMCSQTRITSKDFSAQVSLINDTRSFTVTAGKIKELIDSYLLN